jgi:hypothetical protein
LLFEENGAHHAGARYADVKTGTIK